MNIDTNQTFALDGDILAYRVAAVCEEDFAKACDAILDGMLREIAQDTGVRKMRIYLSGKGNFRNDIAVTKPYKGNRDGKTKPQHVGYCYDYLRNTHRAITVDGYEADDAIASDMYINGAYHCGIDKDLYQMEGLHYNFVTCEWKEITKEQARLNHCRQVLTGDSTDNIVGLPRVGEKTAAKVIQDYDTAFLDMYNYYAEICKERIPDVDGVAYYAEQAALITLKRNLSIVDLVTTKIEERNLLGI